MQEQQDDEHREDGAIDGRVLECVDGIDDEALLIEHDADAHRRIALPIDRSVYTSLAVATTFASGWAVIERLSAEASREQAKVRCSWIESVTRATSRTRMRAPFLVVMTVAAICWRSVGASV